MLREDGRGENLGTYNHSQKKGEKIIQQKNLEIPKKKTLSRTVYLWYTGGIGLPAPSLSRLKKEHCNIWVDCKKSSSPPLKKKNDAES